MAAMITGVDFVTVPTRDLEASRAFYGDVLGLPCTFLNAERGFAEFEAGNLTLSVIVPERMGRECWVNGGAIALRVDDVAAIRARLQEAGVDFTGETFDTGVCHMGFFRDPHGNALMLHRRYAPR